MTRHPEQAAFAGRAYPMTTITPIAPHRRLRAYASLLVFRLLRLVRANPVLSAVWRYFTGKRPYDDLHELSFIHFARWTLAKPRHFGESLRDRYLIFSSNFNGDWHQYLDAFAFTLTRGMDSIWGTSRSYPGAQPVTPFKAYARQHSLPASYYYNAYPGASVRDIRSALEVERGLDEFLRSRGRPTDGSAAAHRGDDAAAFAEAYRQFVAGIHSHLGSADVGAASRTLEHEFR